MKFIIYILCLSSISLAQITKNKTSFIIEKQKVVLNIENGFHFNNKAPSFAYFNGSKAKTKLDLITDKKIEISFNSTHKNILIKYYVCDDAKTVCEPNEINLDLVNKSKIITSSNENNKVDSKKSNSIDSTYKKTTLLIFTAPWCPPCQRMKTETYVNTKVKNQFKKIDVRFLNRDLAENATLADQFKIQFIPTLVLVDKNGQEVRRWLGFQPANAFADQLQTEIKAPLSVQNILKLKEPLKPILISKLIRHYASALEWDNVLMWASKSTNAKDKPYGQQAQIEKLKENETAENKKQIISLLKVFSEDKEIDEINRLFFISDYFDEIKNQNQDIDFKKLQADIDFITNIKNKDQNKLTDLFTESERFDYYGFEKIKIISILMTLHEMNKSKDIVSNLKQELKTALDSKPLDMIATGSMLDLADYYEQIGDDQKVETIYKDLIQTHPNTYVFFDNYAYYLITKKRYKEALDNAEKALLFPEGNDLTLTLRKAEALAGLKQKAEVLKIITNVESASTSYPERLKKRLEKKIKKIKDGL